MMGGFGMVEGDELFEKSSSVGSEVGKWSGGHSLSVIGVLAMIARFVKSRSYPFQPSFQQYVGIIVQSTCSIQQ